MKDKTKLEFNVIDPNEIIVKCLYGYYGKYIYPNKIKEARDLFERVIPLLKNESGHSIYYPIDELRMKRKVPKIWEGDRKRMQEDGIGYHYKFMGRIDEMGYHIKKLHDIVAHNIDRLKVFRECKIIWGQDDNSISHSIHDFKPFEDLEDWKKLKLSEDIAKENAEKFKVKYSD